MAILDKKLVMFDDKSIVGGASASTASTELDLGIGYDALIGSDAVTHQGSATVTFRF